MKRRLLGQLVALGCLVWLHASSRDCDAQLAIAPWPMFQHDLNHTGQSTVVGPLAANLKWRYLAPGSLKSAPAVGPDGTIYAAGPFRLCALDSLDGSVHWCSEFLSTVRYTSPAIGVDGTIYIGGRDNHLHAINADGTLKWAYPVGVDGDVLTSPAIGLDGTIYFSGTARMIALNPDGTLKWRTILEPISTSSPAVANDGTIYVGSLRGILHALNADGTIRWATQVGVHTRFSSPSIASDGTVYIGTYEGLSAVNPDGTVRWQFPTAGRVETSAAIATDGTIYVGANRRVGGASGTIYALNPDGSVLWSYETGASTVRGGCAIGLDGTVYAPAGAGVFAFGPGGTLLWRYSTGANIFAPPAIGGDGTLYVPSTDHNLYAFQP